MLKAVNLSKSYKGREVVRNVSITVEQGEIVGLLGPNGAGKTTCFYMIVGLVRADAGEVSIDDHALATLPIHRRSIYGLSYLPQDSSIFRTLSVEKNIMAILETRKDLSAVEKQFKLESLIEEFKIGHIRHNKGINLSGGERRRVEIARSLAMDPEFILLDEPFAGIDPISVGDLQEIIYQLRDKGIGILITDHNYREMLDTCNYSYVLHSGKIIAQGGKESILTNDEVKKVYLGETISG
jgi:lipopolysaccharide export system ATP-binding protein